MKKVVIVTGSSRGLGKEIAKKFALNNYNLVITYNNNVNEAIKLTEYLDEINVDYLVQRLDLSNEESIIDLIKNTIEKFGRIDCLVNNAGICNDCDLLNKTKEDFLSILDVNLVGPFLIAKHCYKYLKETKGSIINISSTNGIDTNYPESVDYDASKSGLISLTKNLAKRFAPDIRVNCVAPGWMNTDMCSDLENNYKIEEENKILLKRFGNPEEVANVVYFLASEESSYINNTIIRVDGGY